jgi:lipopolysaccharide heptosyltransferase II
MRVFNPRKLRFAKAIDSLGRMIFRLSRTRRPGVLMSAGQLAPRRILVLESHLIGDIVMATPALRALRDHFPSAEIILVAGPWAKELLRDQGLVNDYIEVRFPWATYDYSLSNLRKMILALRTIRGKQWDLAIDLRGDIRNIVFLYVTGATRRLSYDFTGGEYLLTDTLSDPLTHGHVVDYNVYLVEQLGCHVGSKEPTLSVSDDHTREARAILQSRGVADESIIIGIHPGASKPLRHWKADRFARLADLLLEDPGNTVLLFQGPQDRQVVRSITERMVRRALILEEPLSRLPALFKCCAALIGLDSGAVHVAAAVGTPTVVLFGPAEPERVKPFSRDVSIVIKEGYWCRPCDQVHCVQPENNCMDALQVESVHEHIRRILMKPSHSSPGYEQ